MKNKKKLMCIVMVLVLMMVFLTGCNDDTYTEREQVQFELKDKIYRSSHRVGKVHHSARYYLVFRIDGEDRKFDNSTAYQYFNVGDQVNFVKETFYDKADDSIVYVNYKIGIVK